MAKSKKTVVYQLNKSWLLENKEAIIENLDEESLAAYTFIKSEWDKGDVTRNPLFQFVFRSFYRIDNAGLTKEFKKKYFEIMESKRGSSQPFSMEAVCKDLYEIKRHKGDNSLQFSFVTKMANTIFEDMPIYDSEVASMYGFKPPTTEKDLDKKLEKLMGFYDMLTTDYQEKVNDVELNAVFDLFDTRFGDRQMPVYKKLDFIVWSAGKLYKNI